MGRSSADAEVQSKNSAECSAWFGSATCDYLAEVRPNLANIRRHLWLCICGVNQSQYTHY